MPLRPLPIVGSMLKELRVYGNAKDCDVEIETTNPDWEICFEMRDPSFQIDLRGRVQSTIFEKGDDVYLGVRYLPLENLEVQEFAVDYPGTEDEWQNVLEGLRDGRKDSIDWMLKSAHLKVVPVASRSCTAPAQDPRNRDHPDPT